MNKFLSQNCFSKMHSEKFGNKENRQNTRYYPLEYSTDACKGQTRTRWEWGAKKSAGVYTLPGCVLLEGSRNSEYRPTQDERSILTLKFKVSPQGQIFNQDNVTKETKLFLHMGYFQFLMCNQLCVRNSQSLNYSEPNYLPHQNLKAFPPKLPAVHLFLLVPTTAVRR